MPIEYALTLFFLKKKKLDPTSIVSAYLTNHQVVSKNTTNQTFEFALRVFVALKQTPVSSSIVSLTYNGLRERFTDLCARHEENKKMCLPEMTYFYFPIAVHVALYYALLMTIQLTIFFCFCSMYLAPPRNSLCV